MRERGIESGTGARVGREGTPSAPQQPLQPVSDAKTAGALSRRSPADTPGARRAGGARKSCTRCWARRAGGPKLVVEHATRPSACCWGPESAPTHLVGGAATHWAPPGPVAGHRKGSAERGVWILLTKTARAHATRITLPFAERSRQQLMATQGSIVVRTWPTLGVRAGRALPARARQQARLPPHWGGCGASPHSLWWPPRRR